ncbi:cupin-like domain-containing protein [Roseobacter sinensis]|uniref:Cupin-like domain-containing protein n=1 Tax=Roseobacter sinensis TaxID=2931391 RepID=A0ABT3BIJ1_9RHOB|nr:cupin-like domain-containing protein [Roseobacter sp. WL0113]MCV3273396.1 cupin-like domain-containing protein [Roseobacter sp. WL0113]
MNVAYPQSDFVSPQHTVEGFIKLVQDGFENPERRRGTVRVTVQDYPQLGFRARFADELLVDRPEGDYDADTEIKFPISTLELIFREFDIVDWRSPEIIGSTELAGDQSLAFLLAFSCLRPSDWTLQRFASVERLHRDRGYRNGVEVQRLNAPSQYQLLEAMEDSRPVIVSGLEPSPPCRDWSLERLEAEYGDVVVCMRSASDHVTMRQFVDELRTFENTPTKAGSSLEFKAYTEGSGLPDEMWANFGPMYFDAEDFVPPQLWLGSVATGVPATPLHRDPLTGFLFQVVGRKRLDLYSADQADLLYPYKSYNNYQKCWFQPDRPDHDRYPKAREAKCISVELHPGELLVQPAGWFHQVYALDSPTMSVSYFWRY